MHDPARFYLLATYLLLLSLTTCAPLSTPSTTPVITSRQASEKARRIRARTTGLRTLAAVLSVTFSNPRQRDTFDMIVNYDATGKTRYTAFKDLILGTKPIFDLLFIGDRYHLTTHDTDRPHRYQGRMSQFALEHPDMRVFALVGEAFFLPGYDALGQQPVAMNAAGTRFTSRLKSGLEAIWFTRLNSLEIISARLDGELDSAPLSFQLTYGDYRSIAAYDIPARVTLIDPSQGLTTQAWIKQIEINTPLAPGVFDVAIVRRRHPTRQYRYEGT